jgi:hypothetical protein
MDVEPEHAIIDPVYTLEQAHPKVYSMMSAAGGSLESQSHPAAPPGITVIPNSTSSTVTPIRFEVPIYPLSPDGLTRPMTFQEFLDFHKDQSAVMEFMKDPMVYNVVKNILTRAIPEEIEALRHNLPHIRDFRSFRSTLVEVIGNTDKLLTQRSLHDPVCSFFRTSTATEFNDSEICSQFDTTQKGRSLTQTPVNAFLIEEE